MRRRLVIAAAVVALVAAPVAVWAWPSSEPARELSGSRPPIEAPLPDFSLRDHEGLPLAAADLRGKVVVVTFLETRCTAACPIIAEHIRDGLARLSIVARRGTVAIAISTHPGDDTPAAVREFLARHRVTGDLRYLIGTEAELRPVWKAFAILPALDTGDANSHSAPVRIFDPAGTWVSTLHPGADLTPASLANDVLVARG